MPMLTIEPYPFGRRFAVSMTDDTDGATLAGVEPVYRVLIDHDIRVTKTVWPLRQIESSGDFPFEGFSGATLQDADYVAFCQELEEHGFEIALHTASAGNNPRGRTLEAYDLYARLFGHDPATNIMHRRNRENIYWGKDLISNSLARRCVELFEPQQFYGHVPDSPYYWGDICRTRTRYVRGLQTLGANTLGFDPALPYHDPSRPDVNWWFSASYGVGTRLFELLNQNGIEELGRSRGACIPYVYLMHYAVRDGNRYRAHPRLRALARRLAEASDGWYVPACVLLDRLRTVRSIDVAIGANEIAIINRGDLDLEDAAISLSERLPVLDARGRDLTRAANSHGQIPIGTVKAGSSVRLSIDTATLRYRPLLANRPRKLRLALGTIGRIAWQYMNGRRGRGNRANPPQPRWIGDLREQSLEETAR